MSNNENPIHAPKPGRPFEGPEPRVSRTVTIAAATDRFISANLRPGEAPGRVIDRLVKAGKKKKPATVSTPSPAKPATGNLRPTP